jgi:hypothetical protein
MPPPPWATGQHPWTRVVQAYTMLVPQALYPGVLGPRPATHQAFFAVPPPGTRPVYTATPDYHGAPPLPLVDPALMHALHSASNAGKTGGTGDFWFMDSGASSRLRLFLSFGPVFVSLPTFDCGGGGGGGGFFL